MIEDSQNLDKLPDEAKAMIAYAFREVTVGWTLAYMIEVRLDDPVTNLGEGGDGLVLHGGNGSRSYAKHCGEEDWAIVHREDAAWSQYASDDWADRGKALVDEANASA